MSFPDHSVHTARDAFAAPMRERLVYAAAIRFFRMTGLWRYPVPASGDFETMTFLDKAYWLHKAERPLTEPSPSSGLREHFERQDPSACVPPGFVASARLRVSAAGDLMSHRYLAASSHTLYADVADVLFDADVSMANLECVVRGAPSRPLEIATKRSPDLGLSPAELDAVLGGANGRYDFLAAACNHSLDFGVDGVDTTIGALRDRGIAWAGVNATEGDADKATILERRGVRLGVLSVSFGLNGRTPPEGRRRIVNRTNLNAPASRVDFSLFERQLAHCREERADFVFAQLHWGMEHELFPRPEQLEVAHRLAEMGVDAVLGHHPHVVQPVEYYRPRRDRARVVPIFYSLGNLTTPFSADFLRRSLVARIELVKGLTVDGTVRTYVGGVERVPVIQTEDHAAGTLRLKRDPR